MKKILIFLDVFILTGLIFGLVLSDSIDFSLDPIIGSVFDHARLEVREKTVKDIEGMCESLKAASEDPRIVLEADSSIDQEGLAKICQKNLQGRDLFIEFFKSQAGDMQTMMGNNPMIAKYYWLHTQIS